MTLRFPASLLALALLAGGAQAAPTLDLPLTVAERLADWQLAHRDDASLVSRFSEETRRANSWEQATFWIGMTALADHLPADRHIAEAVMTMGRGEGWQPGKRPYHADDQAIGQAYLWAARHGAGAAATAPLRAKLDAILASPPKVGLAFYAAPSGIECETRWCWADALFMAPPAWIALSQETGDPRYRRYALAEYRRTVEFLYDPAEHLLYRDSRFFERRDAAGRKEFWSRGNGWVFASLARTIPMLPTGDPDRVWMEQLFREMAARLVSLQKPDGYWAPSLLAPEGSPPETSGTGFFTYGLAWGVKAGLLDRATYEPVARRAWAALERAIQPDGRLGYVQQVSDRPEQVAPSDTQYYGTGAFLLAATAIADLAPARR
ncbi:glycoside hydrolase family 88/105 protein [Sphingomonas sp. PR090111-T3T-6A]|uniref:glycoside hydrolase family 88/105 protein n=1 Tax=Sphingomonas sp. PR090111-T3T-6A TaxID=685778 RepID=UPI0003819845|nr:glycoside hydrolase family 88 protein [Sphingomonas sp. PR090111-T3T-6A]